MPGRQSIIDASGACVSGLMRRHGTWSSRRSTRARTRRSVRLRDPRWVPGEACGTGYSARRQWRGPNCLTQRDHRGGASGVPGARRGSLERPACAVGLAVSTARCPSLSGTRRGPAAPAGSPGRRSSTGQQRPARPAARRTTPPRRCRSGRPDASVHQGRCPARPVPCAEGSATMTGPRTGLCWQEKALRRRA